MKHAALIGLVNCFMHCVVCTGAHLFELMLSVKPVAYNAVIVVTDYVVIQVQCNEHLRSAKAAIPNHPTNEIFTVTLFSKMRGNNNPKANTKYRTENKNQ